MEEDIFAIFGQTHLVEGGEHFGDSEERSNEGVTPRLREEPFGAINQYDREVRRGSAGGHVPRVLLMPGRVGDDEFAARAPEIPVSNGDGKALLTFGGQTGRGQRTVDL